MIFYDNISASNQPQRRTEVVTIGRLAPDFIAPSTQGYVKLSDYRGKWVVLASYPFPFDGVSTTEIINGAQNYSEVLKRNGYLIGLTTGNLSSNLAWVKDIYEKIGIIIPFPIIADHDLVVSELYGMLNPDRMYEETVRDLFIIDPAGKIAAIITYPASTGRNSEEIIRVLDSLQIYEQYKLKTPANWKQGEPVVLDNVRSNEELINRMNNKEALGYYCPFWYLCFTNIPAENTEEASTTQ
jgi:peroxiredoxin (alkyl hydroperoxide reductase subunit C)